MQNKVQFRPTRPKLRLAPHGKLVVNKRLNWDNASQRNHAKTAMLSGSCRAISDSGGKAALRAGRTIRGDKLTRDRMRVVFQRGIRLTILLASTAVVLADEIPTLDVKPICRGIAMQAANPTEKGGPDLSFKECVNSERAVRDELAKIWSTFAAPDKGHCVRLATQGGEPSYTELITCLEMARDVRALSSSAAAAPSTSDMTEKPPSPSPPPTRPSIGDKASPPPAATKEPSAAEAVEPKNELERAKADAFTAKASEAMAQRKLADAEAALQRAKQDAGRAKSEAESAKSNLERLTQEAGKATAEAERAKAEAKAARESEAAAKTKLADVEAAKVAAEEREQACHKAKSGFGARFRSWFHLNNP